MKTAEQVAPLDIPDICFVEDLLRIFRTSRATFYRKRRENRWPIPELPAIDNHARFSGAAVRKYIETGQTGWRLMRR